MKNSFAKLLSITLSSVLFCSSFQVSAGGIGSKPRNSDSSFRVGSRRSASEWLYLRSRWVGPIPRGSDGRPDFKKHEENIMNNTEKRFFENRDTLEEIVIPEGTLEIIDYEFLNCKNLKRVKLPNSIVRIGVGAFWNCTSLESIEIPKSVMLLMDMSFKGCTKLREVKFLGENKYFDMGDIVFENCASLESFKPPKSLMCIRYAVFRGCESLRELYLPDRLFQLKDSILRKSELNPQMVEVKLLNE